MFILMILNDPLIWQYLDEQNTTEQTCFLSLDPSFVVHHRWPWHYWLPFSSCRRISNLPAAPDADRLPPSDACNDDPKGGFSGILHRRCIRQLDLQLTGSLLKQMIKYLSSQQLV